LPIEQRPDLEDPDPEAADDRPRIAVHDVPRRPRQLDAVAVHHEGDRRLVEAGSVEAVERLARDPTGVAAVADHVRGLAVMRPQPERSPRADGHHDAETPRTELGPTRQPRDVAGDVEAATEAVDHAFAIEEAERGERRVVPDARVAVLDRVVRSLVVGDR